MVYGGTAYATTALAGSLAGSGTIAPPEPEPLIPDYIDVQFGPIRVIQHHGFSINLTLQGFVDVLRDE